MLVYGLRQRHASIQQIDENLAHRRVDPLGSRGANHQPGTALVQQDGRRNCRKWHGVGAQVVRMSRLFEIEALHVVVVKKAEFASDCLGPKERVNRLGKGYNVAFAIGDRKVCGLASS